MATDATRGPEGTHAEAWRRATLDLARRLAPLMSSAAVLDLTADAARQLVGFERGAIRLVTEGTDLVLAREWGGGDPCPMRTEGGAVLPDHVVATGRTVIAHDVGSDSRGSSAPSPVSRVIDRTAIGVPLRVGDRLIGVLSLCSSTHREPGAGEIALIEILADHAAIALENARFLEEFRAAQDQLVRAERLAALGEMAGGVAHDFNNLLAVILGRVQLMRMRTDSPDLRRSLDVIESAATDAAQIVRRVQEFTRTRRMRKWEPVDPAQVVQEAVELTRGRWGEEARTRGVSYTITTDLEKVAPIAGEMAELREVFVNILLNAFDAMPEGGSLHLALRPAPGAVVVSVRDTGHGMPRDVRERIFEPFFTTRRPGAAGLGLSVAYGTVQRHGGRIDVDTSEGAGATLTVTLPEGPPVAVTGVPAPRLETPGRPHSRPVRVLVIDDEAPIREVLRDLLSTAGHIPLLAADGPAGLAFLTETEPPDVALIDLSLPGMTGWEIVDRARATHPDLPLVLITGWGNQLAADVLERRGVRRVLAKPFSTDDVLRTVAELGGSAGGSPASRLP